MITFFAAVILLALFAGILLWLFSLTTPARRADLAKAADHFSMTFEPWHHLSNNIRHAGFQLLNDGDTRYVPSYLEDEQYVLFDFTRIGGKKPETQTVIITPCPINSDVRLLIAPSSSKVSSPNKHCFDKQRPLIRLEEMDLPQSLSQSLVYAQPPHKARPLLSEQVQNWLLAHPHLHIEWSSGMILLCQPGYLISGEELEDVRKDIRSLAQALSKP